MLVAPKPNTFRNTIADRRARASHIQDRDARWTKKHGRSFFGYKNHVNADTKHKLIRHYAVTDAAVHDSQELDGL